MAKRRELYSPERFSRLTKRAIIIYNLLTFPFSMYLPLIECFKWEVSYYSVGVQSWLLILEHLWILGPASWKGWWVIFPIQSTLHTGCQNKPGEVTTSSPALAVSFYFLEMTKDVLQKVGSENSRLPDTLALCKPANCTGSPGSLTFHWKSLSFPPGCLCEPVSGHSFSTGGSASEQPHHAIPVRYVLKPGDHEPL